MESAVIFFWIKTIFYTIFGILGIVYILNKKYMSPIENQTANLWPLLLCILAIAVFNVGGDYWEMERRFLYNDFPDNGEWVWPFLSSILPKYNSLFRTVVWGTGLLMFYQTSKKCKVNIEYSCFVFIIFYMFTFGYARAAVACNIVYFVLALLLNMRYGYIKKKILYFISAILLLVLARYMHNTIVPLLIIVLISQLYTLNRRSFIILLLMFPVLWYAMDSFIFPQLLNSLSDEEIFYEKTLQYMDSDYAGQNKMYYVKNYIPILCVFLYSVFVLFKNVEDDKIIMHMTSAGVLVIYFSFLVLGVRSGNTNVFFYRFMDLSYPIMIITIAYTYSKYKLRPSVLFVAAIFVFIQRWIMLASTAIHPDSIIKDMLNRM